MGKGILYGVGVGPGDPEHITLKAVNTIKRCPVVAAPRTKSGAMAALDIAKQAVELSEKDILPLDFTMSHDAGVRAASHQTAARQVAEKLDAGQDVAFLNIGDISIYSTFQYVADILQPQGYEISMVSGVPSFCAAAAELGVSLTEMGAPLCILPASSRADEYRIGDGSTKVWMKSGHTLPGLLETLGQNGVLSKTVLVQNCGMENQRIYKTLAGAQPPNDYFSLVILREFAQDGEQPSP